MGIFDTIPYQGIVSRVMDVAFDDRGVCADSLQILIPFTNSYFVDLYNQSMQVFCLDPRDVFLPYLETERSALIEFDKNTANP